MPLYAYSAFSTDGAAVKGEVSAETEALALDQIARRGLTPVSLDQGAQTGPWWNRDITLFGNAGAIRPGQLERFFSTLSAMLRARFPLPRAIAFCEDQASDATLRRALGTLRTGLENGATLGQAMAEAGPAFPDRFQALISVGEASDQLEEITTRAAALLAAEAKLRRDLRAALIYPIILLGMSALVLGVVVFYLAPTLLPIFASAGAEAPLVLRSLNALGEILAASWPLLLIAVLCLLLAAYGLRARLSKALSAFLLRLPLSGPYLSKRETLRMAQSLHLMLKSGASLPAALASAANAVAAPPFRALIDKARDHVVAGGQLSQTLAASTLIDPMTMALISAGEESDRLPDILETAVETLTADTSQMLTQAIRILTPLLTLIIGLGVGGIILTTITAIMDLNDIAF